MNTLLPHLAQESEAPVKVHVLLLEALIEA